MAIATCFEPSTPLRDFAVLCVAQSFGARDAFIEVLEGYTLSDLVKPRARLQAMLSIETVKPVRAHAGTRRRGREQGRRVH
jgi:Rrf2 family nitric oxide-sensitive transcriptional repressor